MDRLREHPDDDVKVIEFRITQVRHRTPLVRDLQCVLAFDHAGDDLVDVERDIENRLRLFQHFRIDSGTADAADVRKDQLFIQNGYQLHL